MPTSSRCLLGIMKMCSLCRLCCVAPALCPASDPRNYRIAESPNRRGAHFDRIANREALPRDSARFDQPCQIQPALLKARQAARASHGRSLAAPSPHRAKPGSGREPSLVVRGPGSAFVAEGVVRLQGRRRAEAEQGRAQPLPALRIQGRAGSLLGWDPAQIQPAQPEAH